MPSPAALPSHFPSEALLALPAARASAPAPRVPTPLPSPSRERGPRGKFSRGRRAAPGGGERDEVGVLGKAGRPFVLGSSRAPALCPARLALRAPLEVCKLSPSSRRSERKSSQWRRPRRDLGARRGPLSLHLGNLMCSQNYGRELRVQRGLLG